MFFNRLERNIQIRKEMSNDTEKLVFDIIFLPTVYNNYNV